MILVQKKLTESSDMFNIRGIFVEDEPMWRHCTMLIGGSADYYAVPEDEDDLRALLEGLQKTGMERFILGGGSNILVADRGIRGLVIDMERFAELSVKDNLAVLGGGLELSGAAWKLGSAGLAGLDFLFGMPGSVGGAVWMNARCYGSEVSEILEWVEVMDSDGEIHRESFDQSRWSYKRSPYQDRDVIILRAAFRVHGGNPPKDLRKIMRERRNDREQKGHYRAPCAGSAFKNNRDYGSPSGAIIDGCGLKGYTKGRAAVSSWHANIFINLGGAKASDLRALLNDVAQKVERDTGFRLEPEVLSVGDWSGD